MEQPGKSLSPESLKVAEKYGARIFAGDFEACVIVLLNPDGSYETGFAGKMIQCLGLIESAKIDLSEQARPKRREE